MSRRMSAAVTVVAAIGALAAPAGAAAAPVVDTSDLRDAVTLEGVVEHMQEFQDIADANGGNREASSPGYDASVAYVVELTLTYALSRNVELQAYCGHALGQQVVSKGFPRDDDLTYGFLEGTLTF